MKRNAWQFVAVLAVFGLSQTANADYGYYPVSYVGNEAISDEMSEVRSELHTSLTSGYDDKAAAPAPAATAYAGGGCDGYAACGGCGCDTGCGCCDSGCGCCFNQACCDPCNRTEGWVGGAELVFLKPHNSNGTGINEVGRVRAVQANGFQGVYLTPALQSSIDPDFEVTPRFWLGYQRCDGFGFRVRYWDFNHGNSGLAQMYDHGSKAVKLADGTAFHNWDTWVGDIEVTDTTNLGCNWTALISMGFRYVDYHETRGVRFDNGNVIDHADEWQKLFSGIGMVGGVELRRKVTCNLGMYATARASIVMGDEDDKNVMTSTNRLRRHDYSVINLTVTNTLNEEQINDVKYIYELAGGVEYTMPIECTCTGYYFVRAGAEIQYWDNFGVTTGKGTPEDDESVGFGGFAISAGVVR